MAAEGRTARDFCAEQGLSEPAFYAWRRTIAQRDREARPRQQPDRPVPVARPPVFVPVRVTEPMQPTAQDQRSALEVVLAAGRVVRVPAGFDAVTLRQLLVLLEEAPSC